MRQYRGRSNSVVISITDAASNLDFSYTFGYTFSYTFSYTFGYTFGYTIANRFPTSRRAADLPDSGGVLLPVVPGDVG
jgi:hypothetical protein